MLPGRGALPRKGGRQMQRGKEVEGKRGKTTFSVSFSEALTEFYQNISVLWCIKAIYGQCQPEPKGATNPSALRQQTLLNTAVVYF